MGSDNGVCNTGLGLGLDQTTSTVINKSSDHLHDQDQNKMKKKLGLRYDHLLASDLTLGPSDHHHHHRPADDHTRNIKSSSELNRWASSDLTSFSNSSSTTVKRVDREIEEVEIERVISTTTTTTDQLMEDIDQEGSPRKKLRLTKHQSALLEESFKDHTTLNPKQKQDLARQLNLRPRQVEVWFQNRRARTKLKQTEADYEHLKKCCETLTEENKRLQKELQELKSLMKLTAAPLFMQLPTSATLTICPSCEQVCSTGGSDGGDNSTGPFLIGPRTHHFSNNPFTTTHPSAAC